MCDKKYYLRWTIIEILLTLLMIVCCIQDFKMGNTALGIFCGIMAIFDGWCVYRNWKKYRQLKDSEKQN